MSNKIIHVLLFFILFSYTADAQFFSDLSVFGRANLSPTHIVGTLGVEKAIVEKQSILLSIGLDGFDDRDAAANNMKQGWATVAMLGTRRYFNDRRSAFFVEADANIFFRRYNWWDNIGYANESTGKTYTVTLFPNLNVGYSFEGLNFWDFAPTIGLGYEMHLKQKGQNVQNGLMPFIGLHVGYWFR